MRIFDTVESPLLGGINARRSYAQWAFRRAKRPRTPTPCSARSACRRPSPSWRRASGTRSSSAPATTGSPPPPISPAPASGCSCCERRERLGGAATLERPFADQRFIVSPCAYLVGLLDEVVISELELARPRLPGHPGRPEPLVPVRRRQLATPASSTPIALRPTCSTRASRPPTSPASPSSAPSSTASATCCAAARAGIPGTRASPDRERDRAAARRRRGADLDRLRGVDRDDARPPRRRSAAARRDRLPGDDRHLRRPEGPGHGGDPAHAPPGRPARPRLGVGLRRGRPRTGLVRDRRRRARGRCDARGRAAGRCASSRARASSSSPASGSRHRS